MIDLTTIRQLRTKLGISQAQLAARAGVSQAHIAKIELGRVDPRFSTVQKILRCLDDETKENADQYMTLKIIGVNLNDHIKTVAKTMRQNGISQLPVFKGKEIVGTITERDILQRGNGTGVLVKNVMGDAPPHVSRRTSIETVKELLIDFPAVIITDMGKNVGIITKSDLLNKIR